MGDVHPPSAAGWAGGDQPDDRRPSQRHLPRPPNIPFDEAGDPPDPVWNRTVSLSRRAQSFRRKSEFERTRKRSRRGQSEVQTNSSRIPGQGQRDDEEVAIVPDKPRSLSQVARGPPPKIGFLPEALLDGGPGHSHKLDRIRQSRRSSRKS